MSVYILLDLKPHPSAHSGAAQRGFTLIEIMVVITLIALSVAMAVPTFMHQTGASVQSEGRRMQQTLRLLVEEVELTGVPMRWSVTHDGYQFTSLDEGEKWQEIQDPPFQRHIFSEQVKVSSFEATASSEAFIPADEKAKEEEKIEYLGHVFFWPGGVLDISDITITDQGSAESLSLELRPGPGNIKIVDGESK